MNALGRTIWAIAGGHIPLASTGLEPAFTSRDELVVLNSGDTEAQITLTIYYAEREPVPGYHLTVAARRVRRVRMNDLIDPEALPLGQDYGVVVESDVPVVVDMVRVDTSQAALSRTTIAAFAIVSQPDPSPTPRQRTF
jgi:hypothetical protein